MINTDMRLYDYCLLSGKDEYGQEAIPEQGAAPVGQIKMAINITSQAIQDNINYKGCNYIGLTKNNIDDTYIIFYENKRLKTLYVNSKGRYNQAFLVEL